jgi:hypothetical protein
MPPKPSGRGVKEGQKVKELERLGLKQGWVYETIISTGPYHSPHAAPIGIWTDDFMTFKSNLFKGSKTLENVLQYRNYAVNFPLDARSFYTALFEKDQIAYLRSRKIDAPVIDRSSACLELTVKGIEEKEKSFVIEGDVAHFQIGDDTCLFNRARSLVMESLVIATRISHLTPAVAEARLKENLRVIRKVAPDSDFQSMVESLHKKLDLPC